jgi:uncharacterized protein involved in outer membrane biogenesis
VKRIKHILTGLVILVVGIVAALFAIIKSTDFNAYKDVIAGQVKAATGRELVLAGNVEASISLTPRLTVHQVSFRNADSGSEPQMLTFDAIEAEIELIPLLSNEIRIKSIKLSGADILLETDKDGKGNWVMGAGGGGNSSVSLPIIQEVVIDQARLRYRDGQTGKLSAVTIGHLTATAPGPADPISLDLTGKINQAPVALKGSIGNLKLFAQGPLPVDLSGEIANTSVSVHGQITSPATASGLALDVTVAGKTMDDLSPLFEVNMPKFGPYQATGHVTDPDGKYRIENLAGKIGSTDLTGTVEVDPVADPTSINAKLASSHLDLADIGAAPGAGYAKSDGHIFVDDPWDLSALKAIDGQFRINAQQLIRGDVALQNAAADFSITKGLLQIVSLTAALGDGTVGFAANVDAMPAVPTVQARIKATNVDGAPFMKTLGLGGMLQAGRVNFESALQGPGQSLRGLMGGLNGTLHMDMGRGAINSEFAKLLFADIFKLLTTGGSGNAAQINCAVTNFDIADGLAKSRGIVVDTPGATVVGNGTINLKSETMSLRFDTNSKQVNLANLAVPILVTGSITHPNVAPDPLGAVGNTADFAARTVNLATFGVLSSVTGLGESKDLGPNPCLNALDAGAKASGKTGSAGEKIINGLGTAGEGVTQGAEELGKGAVDATKKAGEGVGKALQDLGTGIFGN